MICSECGKQYHKIDRCVRCNKPLCPYCIKAYRGRNYCSDCLNRNQIFFDELSRDVPIFDDLNIHIDRKVGDEVIEVVHVRESKC
jgi:hypothetical protein